MARRADAQRENPLIEPLSLRPREAAAALGISERLLREWTQRGSVPHLRVGNVLLYPVAEIRTWLRDRATRPGPGDGPVGGEGDSAGNPGGCGEEQGARHGMSVEGPSAREERSRLLENPVRQRLGKAAVDLSRGRPEESR